MDASPPSLFNAFYKESPLASYRLQVTFACGKLQVIGSTSCRKQSAPQGSIDFMDLMDFIDFIDSFLSTVVP